jgi:hypothetical protein
VIVKSALAPFLAGEIGVPIRFGRVLRPRGQEKFFQIKLRFRRCAHLILWSIHFIAFRPQHGAARGGLQVSDAFKSPG